MSSSAVGPSLASPLTAVVVARGGAAGSQQTLQTLQSLVDVWADVDDWEVVLVAPADPWLDRLVGSLEGDVRVRWDLAASGEEEERARSAGRTVVVVLAGDAAPVVGSTTLRVPLVDQLFTGDSGSTFFAATDATGTLQWDRDFDALERQQLIVFTNLSVHKVLQYRAAHKVAWLLESPEVYPETTEFVVKNPQLFDLVITNDLDVLDVVPRAVHVPAAGCWIPPAQQAIASKTRWCSMIASQKNVTSGHRARLTMAATAVQEGVHVFGRGFGGAQGFGELRDKAEGLVPYRYSVTVENCRRRGYFSEKVIDCFLTGTIPIYWGTPTLTEVFDPEGVIVVESEDDLPAALSAATDEHYERVRPAVEANFHRALAYRVVEDRLEPVLAPFLSHPGRSLVSGEALVGPMG